MTNASKNTFTRRQIVTAIAAGGVASLPVHAQDAAKAPKGGAGDIVIGQSAHLSGPLAPSFKGTLRGQDMAIETFNRKGGVGGRKVRLITLDDGYDPKKTVENVSQLIDRDEATALYGLASTAGVGGALPVLAEKKVPLIGVYTGSPVLRAKQHPYFFTTMASYKDEVVQMVRNLVTLQRPNIALLYQNSPFGQLMGPVVEETCKELGATLVAKAPLEANGSDAAAAQALGAVKPQAVIFMAFGPSMVSFVKAAHTLIAAPIYCISISNSQQIIAALGDDARGLAVAQIIPYPFRATTPLTRDYHAAMEAAKLPIDYDHYFGYLSMRVLLEGIRRGGKNVSPQSIVTGMESMHKIDLGGYTVDYSPTNHHGSKFVDITIVGPGGRFMR